ncbi:MAG: hypothetical protein EZS28_034343 [Streblomastix strix]|uniref:Uncharacterized protein n=1 Tax=Streblomastix strix TaxID=222440 RepID=A0A5J4UJF7_9EUKA|nr:MAG: hypothetical protein EZS28_034343 [Streblomastix strix]
MPDSKGIEIDRYSRIAEGKRLLFEFYNVKKENQCEFLKNYPGFNWDDSIETRDYNILPLNDDNGNQHFMYIISVEKLLGIKICPICNNHAVYTKDPNNNSKRKMDTHMKECQ